MKTLWIALSLLIVLGLAFAPATAEEEHGTAKLEKVAKALDAAKVDLAKAITIALAHEDVKSGKAIAAKIDLEDGKAVWEVYVLVGKKIAEVEVDAATGKVLEVEFEGDDDEAEDEDEEDDKDDDDKDDDNK